MTIKYYDTIIVGGGFGGITQLFKLREAGYSVHGFERGSFFGGVWHHNRYPGARVDSEIPTYQLWLKETCKGWVFSERFPGYKELQDYFAFVDTQINVSQDFTFESNVSKSHWDDDKNVWDITVTGKGAGEYKCKYLILCTGFAAKKMYPRISNRESFKGVSFHTADWPCDGVDVTNKKVAVIGTGASGVQVVQEIGGDVSELTVFQRTPNTAFPMRQSTGDKDEQIRKMKTYPELFEKLKTSSLSGFEFSRDPRLAGNCSPEEIKIKFDQCWENGGMRFWEGNFSDILTDKNSNKLAYDYWRDKVHDRIKDPRKKQLLAPDKQLHPIFTKRPSLEQTYYDVLNQDNVEIVNVKDEPILEVTNTGLITSEKEYEFDIIIYATGFDAVTGGFYQIDLTGKDGITLHEKWKDGTYTYLGMTIADFPNLFFLYGPQSPSAFCNGPTCCLIQSEWIRDTVDYTEKHDYKYIAPRDEAQFDWKEYINAGANKTLLPFADSWYMGVGREGKRPKECLIYVRGSNKYYEDINKERLENNYKNFIFA